MTKTEISNIIRLADPELKPLGESEVIELLNQPIYLRLAMINTRDGTPLVHPIWYNYRDGKLFAVSNRNGTKIRSLKRNPEVYFLVDTADRGVRGRASAKVIETPVMRVSNDNGATFGPILQLAPNGTIGEVAEEEPEGGE